MGKTASSATSNAASPSGAPGAVLVGLLGRGIALSRTPALHMAEGRALGIPYEYRLIDRQDEVGETDLPALLQDLEVEGFTGINVTFPYKRQIVPHLHSVSPEATRLGAVNTVLFRDGQRHGHNTDYWGFAESLRRGLPDAKRDCVLLLGAGGAGGAVAHALIDSGVGRLLIRDVQPGSAEQLTDDLNRYAGAGRATAVDDLAAAAAMADGIVNTTPVGMAKLPGTPIDAALVEPRHWVADIVYFPLETELLAAARAKGCALLPGSGMAIFQAVRAFELFTGRVPDPDRMRAVFEAFDRPAHA